jgi:hypothetical protein
MISKHINSKRTDTRHDFLINHNDLLRSRHLDRLLYKAAPIGISTACKSRLKLGIEGKSYIVQYWKAVTN